MLRACNYTENNIIKNSRDALLTYPHLYAFAKGRSIFPSLLGVIMGLVIGVVLQVNLMMQFTVPAYQIRMIYIVCIAISMTVAELIWNRSASRKSVKAALPGTMFRVNGGVILNYVCYNPNDAYLIIAEDDLRDAQGNLICIQYPAPPGLHVTPGQRILIAYSDNGAYIPMYLTQQTAGMIPPNPPAYFYSVDWNQVPKLPHPAAMCLDPVSYQMNEHEVKSFAKKCSGLTEIRAKNWIAIIPIGLFLLALLFLLFAVLVGEYIVVEPLAALAVGAVELLIWVLLMVVIVKAISAGRTRGFKKLRYKKKVMFLSRNTEGGVNGAPGSYIQVYEYMGGELKRESYFIHNNVFLPQDIPYGKVIHKISDTAEHTAMGLYYFTL